MSEAPAARPARAPAKVQAHWLMGDGRPACLEKRPKASVPESGFVAAPFCGACLAALMPFRLHGMHLWEGRCLPPDMRPSEALAVLRETPWVVFFDLSSPAGPDTWWFETDS